MEDSVKCNKCMTRKINNKGLCKSCLLDYNTLQANGVAIPLDVYTNAPSYVELLGIWATILDNENLMGVQNAMQQILTAIRTKKSTTKISPWEGV